MYNIYIYVCYICYIHIYIIIHIYTDDIHRCVPLLPIQYFLPHLAVLRGARTVFLELRTISVWPVRETMGKHRENGDFTKKILGKMVISPRQIVISWKIGC